MCLDIYTERDWIAIQNIHLSDKAWNAWNT